MSGPRDPFGWPALRGGEAALGAALHCELGVWGKVHGQVSDYRWIARTPGFLGPPDLDRYLRIGGEDLAVRACAWRAPWVTGAAGVTGRAGAADWFAVGLYPSRARDAAGRAAVLEKRVLRWCRPAAVPVALGALALLPAAAAGDDRCWWDRVGEGDWRHPDYALPLAADAAPLVRPGRDWLATAIEDGIADLTAALPESRLAEVYAALLAGQRPVLAGGLAGPLSPGALAALLLPLEPQEAERWSLCAWVPATLVDAADLGRNWDLVLTARTGRGTDPSPAPLPSAIQAERGARLAAALSARDPGLLSRRSGPPRVRHPGGPAVSPPRPPDARHCHPRLHLSPPDRPGLDALHRFAESVNRRRLDLSALAQAFATPQLQVAPPLDDPAAHPLVGWIRDLEACRPTWVETADWDFKIDQLRAAAFLLLAHPQTLDLVGLPRDPRVPALLGVLAVAPAEAQARLVGHGPAALARLWAQTLACPNPGLVAEIRTRIQKKARRGAGLERLMLRETRRTR